MEVCRKKGEESAFETFAWMINRLLTSQRERKVVGGCHRCCEVVKYFHPIVIAASQSSQQRLRLREQVPARHGYEVLNGSSRRRGWCGGGRQKERNATRSVDAPVKAVPALALLFKLMPW